MNVNNKTLWYAILIYTILGSVCVYLIVTNLGGGLVRLAFFAPFLIALVFRAIIRTSSSKDFSIFMGASILGGALLEQGWTLLFILVMIVAIYFAQKE